MGEKLTDWQSDESRRVWVSNSLLSRAAELRGAEDRCRTAYRKSYMAEPANHLADAYGNAASVLEATAAALSEKGRG